MYCHLRRILLPAVAFFAISASAQQANINLTHNPQKDTEGLVPFSASLNSPQVNDDHTVIFRVKAPDAKDVRLSGAMLTVMKEPKPIPFTKGDDGIWTLSIGQLPVDMYQYNLIIDGLSMGGRHTMYSGLTSLDTFANFGILSAGDHEAEKTLAAFLNDPNVNDKIDYLFVGQGTEEQSSFFTVRVDGLINALKAHGIEHEYYVGGHGGHDWSTWRHLLYYRFLPTVFNN